MEFLVFQHVAHEHPGLIKDWADKREVRLKVVEFWKAYEIPQVLDYHGLIILGGPMGVYEEFPSKEDEVTAIRSALGKIPMAGFCLGSQLLAYALGVKVHKNIVNGRHIKEVGYYNVDLTKEGKKDPLLQSFSSPIEVLEWHGDAFELPQGATLLATNNFCKNQAFRYGGSAYGFLFHFEFTPKMVARQIEVDKEWIHQDFEMDEGRLSEEAKQKAGLMEKQCFKLFDSFVKLGE